MTGNLQHDQPVMAQNKIRSSLLAWQLESKQILIVKTNGTLKTQPKLFHPQATCALSIGRRGEMAATTVWSLCSAAVGISVAVSSRSSSIRCSRPPRSISSPATSFCAASLLLEGALCLDRMALPAPEPHAELALDRVGVAIGGSDSCRASRKKGCLRASADVHRVSGSNASNLRTRSKKLAWASEQRRISLRDWMRRTVRMEAFDEAPAGQLSFRLPEAWRAKYFWLEPLARRIMESGMGPSTRDIMARCSKFSWVWKRACPV